ncbi:hypothetical protein B7760_02445 [Burkholderia glumae]|nr:hypothetical protein B7760_02445 [Burkholderia glumae]
MLFDGASVAPVPFSGAGPPVFGESIARTRPVGLPGAETSLPPFAV